MKRVGGNSTLCNEYFSRALNHSQSKRVRVRFKMSEIGVKMSEITNSLFMITILHQGVTYNTLVFATVSSIPLYSCLFTTL